MNGINSEFVTVASVVKGIKETEKFQQRFAALLDGMEYYIRESGYETKLHVNPSLLAVALIDYFVDIERLKSFHDVDHANSIKIVSYTAYWLLQRKPIQTRDIDVELTDSNERYVFSYIMDFLNKEIKKGKEQSPEDNIFICKKKGVDAFREMLFYFLKYRCKDPFGIEMIIVAFFSGQIYQEDREDLSVRLSSKYK